MKYELTNEARDLGGHTVYRIRAAEDFTAANGQVIKAGTLGGFVESESNLSQKGKCWIYDEAVVYAGATVSGNADVRDGALISGKARISKNAHVYGQAVIAGNVTVRGHAWIDAAPFIIATDDDQLVIEGNCYINGDARIDGTMTLGGNVKIGNGAMIKSGKDVFQVSLNAKDEIINVTFYRTREGFGCTEDYNELVEAYRDVFLRKERVILAELAERMFNPEQTFNLQLALEAALNARACNKKNDELEESDAITDAVKGARICAGKLHMDPDEIAYECPVWKFRLESGRTLEVTHEKKGYYAVRLKEADQAKKYLCIEQKFTKEGSKDPFGEVEELIALMLLEFDERIIDWRIPGKDNHEGLRVWNLWNKNRVVFAVAYGETLEDAIKRTCTRLNQNGNETNPSEWDGEEFVPGTYGGVIIFD